MSGRERDDLVRMFAQRMSQDWAETLADAQEHTRYRVGDEALPRLPYGCETFRDAWEAEHVPCRHCDTIRGLLHDPGCDYEQCPFCQRQVMSCDCDPQPQRAPERPSA